MREGGGEENKTVGIECATKKKKDEAKQTENHKGGD